MAHPTGGRASPGRATLAWLLCAAATLMGTACTGPLRFPAEPMEAASPTGAQRLRYDTDGDGRADYLALTDATGRITHIGYLGPEESEPPTLIPLDAVPNRLARHVVIILDGVGYQTVKDYRDAGHLRLFHEPAPVVSTFPSMTDIALADLFQSVRPLGYEARYFDHHANRLAGGDGDYLAMKNEDWVRCTDYRAGTLVDPLAYLFPHHYLGEEMKALSDLIARRDRPVVVAYLVSAAAMGTKHLLQGQHEVLEAVDRLTQALVWRSRGLVKVTLLSDHGHQLVRERWLDFRALLRQKGWRVTDRLEKPDDVVVIDYGLVTYAAFATRDRARLARTLIEHEGVDLAAYPAEGAVRVVSTGGAARIERRDDGRFRYTPQTGDPLRLVPLLERARTEGRIGPDGWADDRTWLRLTSGHAYPDPVVRLWRAFHGLVAHVPDVVVSLKDGYSAGLSSRAARYPDGASSHGDLARKSSTAMIISTAGPVPPSARPLRMRDLPAVLTDLLGRPWPPPRKEKP